MRADIIKPNYSSKNLALLLLLSSLGNVNVYYVDKSAAIVSKMSQVKGKFVHVLN
jgi:hypothetical protein